MKLHVFSDPLLLDFLKLAAQLPEDEREQISKLTGYEYSIDGAAIGNFTVPGPKWVVKEEGNQNPIMAGGFVPKRPGVFHDFLLSGTLAWTPAYAKKCTRICRRLMDGMLLSGEAHRLETVVPAARLAARPELERWYTLLGYNKEGTHYGYCADGSDAVWFSRVRH